MDNKSLDELEEVSVKPNKELNLFEALIPLFFLIILLSFINNPAFFGDNGISGPNQFALILSAAVASLVGFYNGVSLSDILDTIGENLKQTTSAILILLLVGALSGTWMASGIIPTMVYYGLELLSPRFFLLACVIICAIISLATGSSWTTSATIGIALIGIGKVIGIHPGMIAGAVLSGAYFGDKLSPMSDTTNLAPAMAGTDLFTHIRYMLYTTVPTLIVTMIVFTILGFSIHSSAMQDIDPLQQSIRSTFTVSLWLFVVPIVVIAMIIRKTPPLVALLVGTLLAGVFALIFQPDIMKSIVNQSAESNLSFKTSFMSLFSAITGDISIPSGNPIFDDNDLFSSGGMQGMLGTIWLIISAMAFGGAMEAIGALSRISSSLLKLAKGSFGLVASTVASCLTINVAASDQYLAIVVPGKMFKDAYKERNLAPENLSRSLEDSGTVTSVLIPWNTCGAYQSGVLGVGVGEYFIYSIFNWLSPIMTLLVAAIGYKIRYLGKSK